MTISLAVPDILVARAKSGDLEALEALYRAFETPVYNLALRVLRRPEDAEDVLQETFLEVVRSIKQYRGEGHLWGWIRQIATSKALMRIRHDRVRETEEFHEESSVGAGLGAGAGAGAGAGDVVGVGAMGGAAGMSPGAVPAQIDLERALERLSETARAVVWLHDVEGYTHEEIAEQMGKTVSFSKSQLARAHVRLRRLLDEGVAR
jgi:RNA polymerase sigma factor (sigma-70 family)